MKDSSEQEKKTRKAEILLLIAYGLPAVLAASLWTADLVKRLINRKR